MKIKCVYEHNGDDTILYADNFIGAYTRGESLQAAVRKMSAEAASYLEWYKGVYEGDYSKAFCDGAQYDEKSDGEESRIEIVQEKESALQISDADRTLYLRRKKSR